MVSLGKYFTCVFTKVKTQHVFDGCASESVHKSKQLQLKGEIVFHVSFLSLALFASSPAMDQICLNKLSITCTCFCTYTHEFIIGLLTLQGQKGRSLTFEITM